jgi:radical SAM protein with 4Fe4S-binding SPASM domain
MADNYLQKIRDEFNLNYSYCFSDLLSANLKTGLLLLALDLEKELDLYKEELTSISIINLKKTIDKVKQRSIENIKNTNSTTDNIDFFIKSFVECINVQKFDAKTPFELINSCWPVVLAPNIFTKIFDTIPYPFYIQSIKGENLTKWGKDPYILIEFSLFVKCPVDCSYCPHESLNHASKEKYIDIDKFKLFLDRIPTEVGIVYAGFCEPLLYKNFDIAVKYASTKKYRQFVATTLPDKFENNIDVFFDESLWAGRSIHLRDEFMKYKPDEAYYKNLDKFFRQMQFNKNSSLDNRFSFLGENIDRKIILLLKKHNLIHLHTKLKPYQRIESPIEYKEPERSSFLTGNIYCNRGFYRKQMVVPGGDVVLCCMDVEKKHVLGNLSSHSYQDIYNSKEYSRVMNGFNNEKENTICRRCVYAKQV